MAKTPKLTPFNDLDLNSVRSGVLDVGSRDIRPATTHVDEIMKLENDLRTIARQAKIHAKYLTYFSHFVPMCRLLATRSRPGAATCDEKPPWGGYLLGSAAASRRTDGSEAAGPRAGSRTARRALGRRSAA